MSDDKILVSACLAGIPCRYDGRSNAHPQVMAWAKTGRAIPVCPECAGGLPTPRIPCEIRVVKGEQKVYNKMNKDCTSAYVSGAQVALAVAQANNCSRAVLKAKSPSCGVGRIYDGTFSGRLVDGNGITAQLLASHGIAVMTEADLPGKTNRLYQEANMNKKIKLAVVFGGQTGEHEVSRVSAYNVLKAINPDKYDIMMVGITKQGQWMIYSGDYEKLPDGSWQQDEANLKTAVDVFADFADVDIFYPIMHGPMGEDGTIQGVFEMLGKPYVGCGVLSSAVGMDKVVSKILFEAAGIPVAPYIYFKKRQWEKNSDTIVESIEDKLKYPAFIKPVNMGSSVGISKAHDREELIAGIEEALKYDHKILVESFIDGREIECAVLEVDGEIQTALPGEIIASKEFYDYEAKYSDDEDSKIVIPANLSDDILTRVRQMAETAFEAIDGSGLSRIDFFVTHSTYEIIINEVNTLPGFTDISMYPKMWDNMGIKYEDLVEMIIQTADRKRDTAYTLD